MAGVEARPVEEDGGCQRALDGQLLGVGEAAVIVDREVDPVPADPTELVLDTTPWI